MIECKFVRLAFSSSENGSSGLSRRSVIDFLNVFSIVRVISLKVYSVNGTFVFFANVTKSVSRVSLNWLSLVIRVDVSLRDNSAGNQALEFHLFAFCVKI